MRWFAGRHPRSLARGDLEPPPYRRSNGPTEGLNLCVKRVKRCGRGFKRFSHYRLRVLLHAGRVTWPKRPCPPRIPYLISPLRRVRPLSSRLSKPGK